MVKGELKDEQPSSTVIRCRRKEVHECSNRSHSARANPLFQSNAPNAGKSSNGFISRRSVAHSRKRTDECVIKTTHKVQLWKAIDVQKLVRSNGCSASVLDAVANIRFAGRFVVARNAVDCMWRRELVTVPAEDVTVRCAVAACRCRSPVVDSRQSRPGTLHAGRRRCDSLGRLL